MTPKEIVAAGSKGESTFVRLAAIVERETARAALHPDPEVAWHLWVMRLSELAGTASKEAGRWKRGPATDELVGMLQDFVQKKVVVPTFESNETVPGYTPWVEWVTRLEMAASNRALPELAALIREFKGGKVGVPPRQVTERFGIDFAVRTSSPKGGNTSPSSSPPETHGGNQSGTFRSFADDGKIMSGDGRAPKAKKKTKS